MEEAATGLIKHGAYISQGQAEGLLFITLYQGLGCRGDGGPLRLFDENYGNLRAPTPPNAT